MDETTLEAVKGRFARLCGEIDLSKPLLSKFRLRKKIRRIEYEALHLVCFQCGRYGHWKEDCKHGDSPSEQPENLSPVNDDGDRNAVMESNEVYEEEVDNNEEVEIPHNLEENMARKLKGKETVGASHARKGTKSLNKGETSMMILNAGQNKNKENNQVDPSLEMKSDGAINKGKPKKKGPKVAAAMDHHILVQGNNNNNNKIVRTLVTDSTSNTSHAGMVNPYYQSTM
ncbi:hypothetical protein DITRI_Ditri07aG0008000 [Diplodiscus trichospermus]